MKELLTRVQVHFGRDFFNYYIRFGEPVLCDEYTGRKAFEYYSKGATFGYVRWKAGEFGTKKWQFFILRAGDINTQMYTVPGVTPGAELLANISGKGRIYRLFSALDRIEAMGIDCSDVADWYWIHTNARINSSLEPLHYSRIQHLTWLLEKEVSL